MTADGKKADTYSVTDKQVPIKDRNVKSIKEQILASDDLVTREVEVPEWGCTLIVRTLTGAERDDYEASLIKGRKADLTNMRAKLCAKCIVDQNGKRIFADFDIKALGEKSALALDKVFEVAQELNGIGVKELEELAKNFGAGQSESSASS